MENQNPIPVSEEEQFRLLLSFLLQISARLTVVQDLIVVQSTGTVKPLDAKAVETRVGEEYERLNGIALEDLLKAAGNVRPGSLQGKTP